MTIHYYIDGTQDLGERSKLERSLKSLHREDGPAMISENAQVWYKNGLVHRIDGPAIIEISHDDTDKYWACYERWYYEDKLHRTTGPAEMLVNGGWNWYENGKLHREDGPAYYYPDIKKYHPNAKEYEWYIHGEEMQEEVFKIITTAINIKQLSLFLISPSNAERYLAEKQLAKLKEQKAG
jgi:hypothetical protein